MAARPRAALFGNGHLLPKGQEGEAMSEDFLWALPNVASVTNVTADPYWQAREVDILAELDNGRELRVEVKADQHASGDNFCFELARIYFDATSVFLRRGWSWFSEADHMLIWCAPTLYSFPMRVLRDGLARYASESGKGLRVAPVRSDDRCTTINVYVPKRYVPHRRYVRQQGIWKRDMLSRHKEGT